MTNLETVAAQRDEANTKLRAMSAKLDEAKAEIARLKSERVGTSTSGTGPPIQTAVHAPRGEVPVVTPEKAKRPGIFGGGKKQ